MLEIAINGKILEIPPQTITYNVQANDIADLESRQCNYTNGFSIPKTLPNTRYFEDLGLVGDISTIPYTKVNADLIDNGVHIIRNGWLEVQETTNEYKINIRDGIIDLFKAIGNKSFGDNIDLSEINHNKDLTTVINSFTNENYRYIINDYGGLTHLDTQQKINIDYLVPSARVKYLWNKIFTTFGFEYEGNVFNTSDFDGLWLTYPKGIPLENIEITDLYAEFLDYYWENASQQTYPNINIIQGSQINSYAYVVPISGTYKIKYAGEFNAQFLDWSNTIASSATYFQGLYVNGVLINSNQSASETFVNVQLNVGDVITIDIYSKIPNNQDQSLAGFSESKYFKVEKYQNAISFSDELKQLTITEFMKEILWRFNLTIFQDINGKYIFKTFDERLQSGVIDWSKKYKERTSETYTPKDYGQTNYFRQNYNDKEGNFNDGYFTINNQNLSEKKTILSSKFYSHDKDLTALKINTTDIENIYVTPLWEKEVSENTGVQDLKYKDLNSRFYLLRTETISKTAILASDALTLQQTVNSLPVARFYMTTFKDFVPKYYSNIQTLLNDFRFHKMKIDISNVDVHNLDLDKIYYFEQEQNYYFINKVSYTNGKISNAEFYRVKYTESTNYQP